MANSYTEEKKEFFNKLRLEDEKKIKEVQKTLEKLKVVYLNRKDK